MTQLTPRTDTKLTLLEPGSMVMNLYFRAPPGPALPPAKGSLGMPPPCLTTDQKGGRKIACNEKRGRGQGGGGADGRPVRADTGVPMRPCGRSHVPLPRHQRAHARENVSPLLLQWVPLCRPRHPRQPRRQAPCRLMLPPRSPAQVRPAAHGTT
jgi:hypothetical protein